MLKRRLIIILFCLMTTCWLMTACNNGNHNATTLAEKITTTNETIETIQAESSIPSGYQNGDLYGMLHIDDIGMHINIYCADISLLGTSAQEITDAEDSAAFFKYGNQYVIADHDYQGFDKILEVNEGMEAVIDLPNGQKEIYKCVNTAVGYNAAEMYIKTNSFDSPIDEEFDEEVVNLFDFKNEYLVMYTCNGSTEDIYITFWQKA